MSIRRPAGHTAANTRAVSSTNLSRKRLAKCIALQCTSGSRDSRTQRIANHALFVAELLTLHMRIVHTARSTSCKQHSATQP
jgi:hypothetical protein